MAGLPPGSTESFALPAVGVPGSAELTMQTASTTPPGGYSLAISGVSASTTHSTSATLVVDPPPDFSLSLAPGSRRIERGASRTFTVSIGSQGGFTGGVTFAVAGLPSGTSATFTPAVVAAPGSSTLRVTTMSTAPRGKFAFTVSGSGSSGSHAVVGKLTLR